MTRILLLNVAILSFRSYQDLLCTIYKSILLRIRLLFGCYTSGWTQAHCIRQHADFHFRVQFVSNSPLQFARACTHNSHVQFIFIYLVLQNIPFFFTQSFPEDINWFHSRFQRKIIREIKIVLQFRCPLSEWYFNIRHCFAIAGSWPFAVLLPQITGRIAGWIACALLPSLLIKKI